MSATPRPTRDALLAHRDWVRRLARRLVADPHLADDVEQQTWLSALAAPPRDGRSPRGWLGAVARNAARKLLRGDRRRGLREAAAGARGPECSAEELVATAELHHRVSEAVLALSEPYRATLLWRFVEDLPPREVAARMDVPVETVRTRTRRALDLVRARLDGADDDWRSALLPLLAGGNAGAEPTASATAPLATGTVVMTTTAKLAFAVAALVVVVAVWWNVDRDAHTSAVRATPGSSGAERTQSGRAGRPGDAPTDADRDAPAPLPASGFAAIDRDRDAHGVVVDAEGRPLAGATVQAIDYPWLRFGPTEIARWREIAAGPAATTAADGAFALRLSPGDVRSLRVRCEGFASMDVADVQAGARVRIVLDRGVRLLVTVRGPRGETVAGATVRAVCLCGVRSEPGFAVSATSGADGAARLDGLPAHTVATLQPDAPGLVAGDWPRIRTDGPGEQRAEVRLVQGRRVAGRVIDAATGSPVGGAEVSVGWTFARAVRAADDGTFTQIVSQGDGVRLCARAPGTSVGVVLVPEAGDVEVVLAPAATLRGRVVGADGVPVAGALLAARGRVTGGSYPFDDGATAISGADGMFVLGGLRHDVAHTIVVAARRFGLASVAAPAAGTAGATKDVGDVVLALARRLDGVVVDECGRPIEGVQVAIGSLQSTPPRADEAAGGWLRVTDDLGRFRVADLPGGTWRATARGAAAARDERTLDAPPPGGTASVTLTLRRDRRLVVRVTGPDGLALAGATVSLSDHRTGIPVGSATADASGAAELVPAPGRYGLHVRSDDPRGLMSVTRRIEVGADGGALDVRLDRRCVVAGRIVDGAGAAFAGGEIHVERDGVRIATRFAEQDGSFRIDVAGEAPVDVVFLGRVLAPGKTPTGSETLPLRAAARDVLPGGPEVVLHCERVGPRRLVVAVTLPDGSPAAGVRVTVRMHDAADWPVATTDGTGRATFDDLPRLSSTALTDGTGEWFGSAPARIGPDDIAATVVLRPSATIEGVVVGPDGRGRAAEVRADLDGEPAGGLEAAADGTFRFRVPAVRGARLRVVGSTWSGGDELEGTVENVAPGASGLRIEMRQR